MLTLPALATLASMHGRVIWSIACSYIATRIVFEKNYSGTMLIIVK